MNQEIPFKLFACCIPVKGAERSTLCDLQRRTVRFIPNGMYEILTIHDGKTIQEIKACYDNTIDEMVDEYFDFLEQEEYIFLTTTPGRFPKMDMRWDEPARITHAIIDLDEQSPSLPWSRLTEEFGALGCAHLQIRSFSPRPLAYFEEILSYFERSIVRSIELILHDQDGYTTDRLVEFCSTFHRVSTVHVHSASTNEPGYVSTQGMGNVFFTDNVISSDLHCGVIHSSYFSVNIKTFTESLAHNSCLNRKIAIDARGNIKNCPSLPDSFGAVEDTSLLEAITNPGFTKHWNITKDQVRGCQDCEFRYICTDCRAFLEDPADAYSKPLKCGYNPYTCQWEEWSENPLKQNALDFYRMQDIVSVTTQQPDYAT